MVALSANFALKIMGKTGCVIKSKTAVAGNRKCDSRVTLCLLYTSDAADERSSVDLGGRRIIKKKKQEKIEGIRCK